MIRELIAVALSIGSFGVTHRASEPLVPPNSVWIEAIEEYELPWDPEWEKAAISAAQSLESEDDLRRWFRKTADELITRRKNAGTNDRSLDAIAAWKKSLVKTLTASSKRSSPISVLLCWDGIGKHDQVLFFGNGQRATRSKLKVGLIAEAEMEESRPGDDFQGIRSTAATARVTDDPPSDYARFTGVDTELKDLAFGEIDPRALTAPVTKIVEKNPAAGSGHLEFYFDAASLPTEIELMKQYPWYLEFRLFELDQDGGRVREAAFTGSRFAVAIPGTRGSKGKVGFVIKHSRAIGRVKLKKPAPWGYEMEVVRWFGVADKSKLLLSKKGNVAPAAPTSDDATTEPEPTADEPTKIPADGAPRQPADGAPRQPADGAPPQPSTKP